MSTHIESEKKDRQEPHGVSHESPQKRGGATLRWVLASLLGAGSAAGGGYLMYENVQLRNNQDDMERRLGDAHRSFQKEVDGVRGQLSDVVNLSDLDEAAEYVTPATVRVEGPLGLGSGVIITDRLGRMYILTNGHVTEGNSFERGDWNDFRDAVYKVTMYTGNDFKDGVSFDAAPVVQEDGTRAHSYSDKRDLAVLHIPPEIERKIIQGEIRVPAIHLWNHAEDKLRVGTPVIAVGNPFGERDHVSQGIISHTHASGGSLEPENVFVRTTAPINGGNSGGGLFAVVRESGELKVYLVGINTWGYRGGDGVSGSIDMRIVALEAESWGIPLVSEEVLKNYQEWWERDIKPRIQND